MKKLRTITTTYRICPTCTAIIWPNQAAFENPDSGQLTCERCEGAVACVICGADISARANEYERKHHAFCWRCATGEKPSPEQQALLTWKYRGGNYQSFLHNGVEYSIHFYAGGWDNNYHHDPEARPTPITWLVCDFDPDTAKFRPLVTLTPKPSETGRASLHCLAAEAVDQHHQERAA